MRKVALVIGIEQYEDGNDLPNAINDAKDVANALKQIGFNINEPKLDLTHEDMDLSLTKFKHSLNSGDFVLFYFAGHGTQWEDQNYLIPSDNLGINGIDIRTRAINAQDILNQINLKKPLATIFILDCCRTYHLRNVDIDKRDRAMLINQPKGLKGMSNEHESLIVFACAAGTTADDCKKDRNGLFTKHFLKHIYSQNEHVQMMLIDVISGVKEESNSKQIPCVYSSLSNKRLFLNETFIRAQNDQFKNGGASKSDICNGRLCANCGKCRDWYFTGDRETWNWVRNYKNWNQADRIRYYDDRTYQHFKRRDGYSCFRPFFDRPFRGHCLCEDNIRP